MCDYGQKGVDIIIPVRLENYQPESYNTIGLILIQVKNRQHKISNNAMKVLAQEMHVSNSFSEVFDKDEKIHFKKYSLPIYWNVRSSTYKTVTDKEFIRIEGYNSDNLTKEEKDSIDNFFFMCPGEDFESFHLRRIEDIRSKVIGDVATISWMRSIIPLKFGFKRRWRTRNCYQLRAECNRLNLGSGKKEVLVQRLIQHDKRCDKIEKSISFESKKGLVETRQVPDNINQGNNSFEERKQQETSDMEEDGNMEEQNENAQNQDEEMKQSREGDESVSLEEDNEDGNIEEQDEKTANQDAEMEQSRERDESLSSKQKKKRKRS